MKPIQLVLLLSTIALCASQTEAQWVHTNGIYGGHIHELVVSGTNLFAGTEKGVYRRPLSELITSNVKETGITPEMQLSPNPTSGFITITGAPIDAANVTLMNLLGEAVLTTKVESTDLTLDLSGFPNGAYIVRFLSKGSVTAKIIIKD